MATKSTHKKKNFNKKHLVDKLDKLAERVSSKDIFVVSRNQEFYTVIDYKTKAIKFNHLPNRKIADKICSRVNRKKLSKETIKEIYSLLEYYYKLQTDCKFYSNTISTTSNEITLLAAVSRLELSQAKMYNVVHKILTKC